MFIVIINCSNANILHGKRILKQEQKQHDLQGR
jgi:hypothetical protein